MVNIFLDSGFVTVFYFSYMEQHCDIRHREKFIPIAFIHIPKSAGSSLHTMLSDAVGPEFVYPERHRGPARASSQDRQSYRLFSGHFDHDEITAAPSEVRLVTILRDPVARVLSRYWYSRSITDEEFRRTGCEITRWAKTAGQERFYREAPDHVRGSFQETATRQLVGSNLCLPDAGFRLPRSEIIAIAKQRLRETTAFGIAEQFDASAVHIFERLGLDLPAIRFDNGLLDRIARGHAEPVERTEPSPGLLSYLEEITELDREMYRYAVGLLKERMDRAAARRASRPPAYRDKPNAIRNGAENARVSAR